MPVQYSNTLRKIAVSKDLILVTVGYERPNGSGGTLQLPTNAKGLDIIRETQRKIGDIERKNNFI